QFCLFQKSVPFCPQEWGAVLAGGKRLPPTEAKRRQGIEVLKTLFYSLLIISKRRYLSWFLQQMGSFI
ncbi:MAG: hypothetical protein IKJ68_09715, partial [Clostridia bacterium]|nr:hypothetical protein [Clostridia bacterium]